MAFKLATSLALASIVSACSAGSDSISPLTFNDEINNYSEELVAKANEAISSPSSPSKTTDMPSYVVTYVIEKDEIKTKKDADTNKASFAINSGITKMWSDLFCTPTLKSIMAKYNVAMVTGQLISKDGDKHSISICMR